MQIQKFSYKRPVSIIMIFLAGILFGIISLGKMEIDILPPVQFPEISIITLYAGSPPVEVEELITKPVEEAVNGVYGVKRVRSESIEGASLVVAAFDWGTDMDFASIRVREKVDQVKGLLPQDSEKSIVARFDPDSLPVMGIAVQGKGGINRMRKLIELRVKPLLDRIEGVGNVKLHGGRLREIQVFVDLSRLYAHRLSIYDIIERINLSNYNFPAGSVNRGKTEFLIRTIGEFKSLEDIENVLIKKNNDGRAIYVRDVARVVDGFKERNSLSFFNGSECINISIIKEAGKNAVNVCEKVRDAVDELNRKYGDMLKLSVYYDGSKYIRNAVSNVSGSAILGGIIAFIVIFIFLRDMRKSFIIIAVIPSSIMITILLMYVNGISLNMMSLGGLALGVGMLVDNGIVIIESVQKKVERGLDRETACVEGISEVKGPLLASTMTSVVVFLPIVFVRGVAGEVFSELAITVSASLLISYIVSISLAPALFSLMDRRIRDSKLPVENVWNWRLPGFSSVTALFDSILSSTEIIYSRIINRYLKKFRTAFITGLLSVFLGISLILFLDTEFLPETDSGAFTIRVAAEKGTPLESTRDIILHIDKIVSGKDYVAGRSVDIGFNPDEISEYFGREKSRSTAEMLVALKGDRAIDTIDAMNEIRSEIELPDGVVVDIFSDDRQLSGIVSGTSSILVDVAGDRLNDIDRAVGLLLYRLKKCGHIENPVSLVNRGKPEIRLEIDKKKLSSFGIALGDVAEQMRAFLRGEEAGNYFEPDNQVDITVRLREEDRKGPGSLEKILIRVHDDNSIPLSTFARTKICNGYNKIIRKNQQRCFPVKADPHEGSSRREAMNSIAGAIDSLNFPNGVNASISEQIEDVKSSVRELILFLMLSVLLIYMILASQFESLTRPFLIMLTVPLTISGVSLSLFLTGNSINIISVMGMIMLSGIVVNNAIVLLEYIRLNRTRGLNLADSIVRGCMDRLRPILMTTATTVIGLMPLAIGLQRGSEIQSPLAVTVMGGLIGSTVLTLVLIPIYYYRFESEK